MKNREKQGIRPKKVGGPEYEIHSLTQTNLPDFLAVTSQILSFDKMTQLRTKETPP